MIIFLYIEFIFFSIFWFLVRDAEGKSNKIKYVGGSLFFVGEWW